MTTVTFRTRRAVYTYFVLSSPRDPSSIKAEPGNYMFAKRTEAGYVPIYAGIADDLSDRIPYHEQWTAAMRLGTTHVLAHIQQNVSRRKLEEQDIIAWYQPPLNVQHRRPTPKTLGGLG